MYILPKAVGGGGGKIRVFKGFLGRIRNFDNMLYLCVLCCGHVGPGKNKDFLVEYTPMRIIPELSNISEDLRPDGSALALRSERGGGGGW